MVSGVEGACAYYGTYYGPFSHFYRKSAVLVSTFCEKSICRRVRAANTRPVVPWDWPLRARAWRW